MFLGKTAFAGGARWLDRWWDSRVAKFSGHTSHGTMKVTAIFAWFGHSIGAGRGTAALGLSPPRGVLDVYGTAGKSTLSDTPSLSRRVVGWAKALALAFDMAQSIVRRAHAGLHHGVGTAYERLCRVEAPCQRLCPPYGAAI